MSEVPLKNLVNSLVCRAISQLPCSDKSIRRPAPFKIDPEAAKTVVESAVTFINGSGPTPNIPRTVFEYLIQVF